jgi:signal transduction histidine kinase
VSTLVLPLPTASRSDLAKQLTGPGALELVVEMAHDLRSPLSSILVLAEALREGRSGVINEVQRRQLDLIYSAALSLCATASDLTELVRGGERLMDPDPVPFSLSEMLSGVESMVQPMVEEKGLELVVSADRPDRRVGSARPLSRVLLNLTTNAIKYTEEGRVELLARSVGPTRVEFSVRDTGPGIPADALPRLFQAFRRGPLELRQHFSSSGLGLAICHKLVGAMGAELCVESSPGEGTEFHFELSLPAVEKA